MAGRSMLACLLTLLTFQLTRAAVNAPATAPQETFLYTVAKQYQPLAWLTGQERFPAGASVWIRDAAGTRPLAPDFFASADPAVSFDGKYALVAARPKPQDAWQIWQLAFDTKEWRRITSSTEDCIRPLYLPDNRVVYARKTDGHFGIEALEVSGGKPLPLTYGPENSLPTDVLRDGRILFEAGYPLGSASTPEIYTVYSDGSGIESYRCDHGNARYEGRQTASGDIIFTSGYSLARFTSARAQQLSIAAPAGEYAGDIAELSSGDWIVPWRSQPKSHFGLVRWHPGSAAVQPVLKDADADIVQPVLLAERAVPNRHPSGLHDWPNANLLCLNAYTSKFQVPAGAIHSVRLFTRDEAGAPQLLGTAPVERDGSFFLHVPSDRPLQIELVDASGKTIRRESGFFWMRRGEQRACVGCHAGPETAPENAVPMILLKSTTPADMTRGDAPNASGGH
jgi:hypothetical protein